MEPINDYAAPKANLDLPQEVKPLASLSNRLLSSLIDGVLSLLVVLPIIYLSGGFDEGFGEQSSVLVTLKYGAYGALIYFLLHGYLLAKRGQTIGKVALGIRIVSKETGSILPFWRVAFFRVIPTFILGLIPLVMLIDILFIFRKDRRCIHDFIGGTKVVDA